MSEGEDAHNYLSRKIDKIRDYFIAPYNRVTSALPYIKVMLHILQIKGPRLKGKCQKGLNAIDYLSLP